VGNRLDLLIPLKKELKPLQQLGGLAAEFMVNVAVQNEGMTEDRFAIVGKVVARTYRVETVVAEGGFGVVYRADHKGFRAKVALKCLKIPTTFNEVERQNFLEQFRSEAEVLFRLSSHNAHIVRPLHVDAFHTDDRQLVPFLALEWLEGRTLGALIAARARVGKAPLSLERVVRLLTPVAQALVFAHNLPDGPGKFLCVVHRDLKPENIFITRVGDEDVPKVLDFGISKAKSTAGQHAGQMSQLTSAVSAFSPAYASPEQWSPKRLGQTGPWTDVWGLALTVVETAKGADVIEGDQAEMMATILDPARRPSPRAEGLTVSDSVEAVFQRALAVDPRERYQAVGEFWDDLTLALGLRRELGTVATRSPSGRAATASESGPDSGFPPASALGPEDSTSSVVVRSPIRPPDRPPLSQEPVRSKAPFRPVDPFRPGGRPAAENGAGSPREAPRASLVPNEVRPRMQSSLLDVRGPLSSLSGEEGRIRLPRMDSRAAKLELQTVSQRPRRRSTLPPFERSAWKVISPGLALLVLSFSLTVLDRTFAQVRGVPLGFGPLRASWLAGALFLGSIVWILLLARRRSN